MFNWFKGQPNKVSKKTLIEKYFSNSRKLKKLEEFCDSKGIGASCDEPHERLMHSWLKQDKAIMNLARNIQLVSGEMSSYQDAIDRQNTELNILRRKLAILQKNNAMLAGYVDVIRDTFPSLPEASNTTVPLREKFEEALDKRDALQRVSGMYEICRAIEEGDFVVTDPNCRDQIHAYATSVRERHTAVE